MGAGPFPETIDCPAGDPGVRRGREGGVSVKPPSLSFHHRTVETCRLPTTRRTAGCRRGAGGTSCPSATRLWPITCVVRHGLQERDGITMANTAYCPNCDRVGLVHTGAFWICPRCGLMITKRALAAEIMRTGGGNRPGEDITNADGLPGSVPD